MIHREVLPGGLKVVVETVPHARSVCIGVWIGCGSRDEDERTHGVCHLIEHMLFKGTEARSAKDLADAIEGRGGQLNAFTSKEHTCLYAKVLDEDTELALDVLSDMILHPRFDDDDLSREKRVVLEEIAGAVRGHWGIGNSLHWVLDITFREDECRIRKDHAPANFATLRHMALNLLKQENSKRRSIKTKRLKAGWDMEYLGRILNGSAK